MAGIISEDVIQITDSTTNIVIYRIGTTTYKCFPINSTALVSEAKWRILRIKQEEIVGGTRTIISKADGDSLYDNIAENYASLTYSQFGIPE